MEKRIYTDARGRTLPYRLLVPDPYAAKRRYPLVLFLHGAGERGDDNEAQLTHGVPEFCRPENRKRFPCFLVAPQCPNGQKWADWTRSKQPAAPTEPLRLVLELLQELQHEFRIDPKRVYVTGLSMGGFGTFDLLRRHPELFAAAVVVCGGGSVADATKFARVPLWAFHGAKDRAVPVTYSRQMIQAIEAAGGQPRYTEYLDVGHDSWVPAYQDAAMFAWLFAQKRA